MAVLCTIEERHDSYAAHCGSCEIYEEETGVKFAAQNVEIYQEDFPTKHSDVLQKAFALLKAQRDHIRMIWTYMSLAGVDDSVFCNYDVAASQDILQQRAAIDAVVQRWISLDGSVRDMRRMRDSENVNFTVERAVVSNCQSIDRYYHKKAEYQFGTKIANEWYTFSKDGFGPDPPEIEHIRDCIAHDYGVPRKRYDNKEDWDLKYDAETHWKAMRRIFPSWWTFLNYIIADMQRIFPHLIGSYPFRVIGPDEERTHSPENQSYNHVGADHAKTTPLEAPKQESQPESHMVPANSEISIAHIATLDRWEIEDAENGFIATKPGKKQRRLTECRVMDFYDVGKAQAMVRAALRQLCHVEDWSSRFEMRSGIFLANEDLVTIGHLDQSIDDDDLCNVRELSGDDLLEDAEDCALKDLLYHEEKRVRLQMTKDAIALQFVKVEGTFTELRSQAKDLLEYCEHKATLEFGERSRSRYHLGDLHSLRRTRNHVAHGYGVPSIARFDLKCVVLQIHDWSEIRIEFLQYMDRCLSHLQRHCYYYDKPPTPRFPDFKQTWMDNEEALDIDLETSNWDVHENTFGWDQYDASEDNDGAPWIDTSQDRKNWEWNQVAIQRIVRRGSFC